MNKEPEFIVIEGPIGVGKTSLAKRLGKQLNAELLLEGAEENPFLERFYQEPRQSALPTQLFFLFQRTRQMQALRQGDIFTPTRVADFLMGKDRLFAEINLDDEEFKLYEQVFSTLSIDAPRPDLVIYLQAPLEVLMQRIAKRGRKMESAMDPVYMTRLVDAYTQFFYYYNESPLLIVNAEEIDLVNNDEEFLLLLEQIKSIRSGRHYFNPHSLTL